jgi:glucosamine kinase
MTQTLFIGVDGGASQCTVRVEDAEGHMLGQAVSGPANIRLSVQQAWQSIQSALEKILGPLDLFNSKHILQHAGMGLAGCEVLEAYEAFMQYRHGFNTLVVSSDAHTACLGAHQGQEGAIIIIGTGVTGFQMQAGQTLKVGGWGFPHDDEGGGAWLGLQAVRATLQWLDGRAAESELVKAIYQHFKQDQSRFVTWANQANSTAFAELAPIVIQQMQASDAKAIHIMHQAARAIDAVSFALFAKQPCQDQPLPCVLIGGIAPFIQPKLSEVLRARLRPCLLTPASGAILLVRQLKQDETR